MIQKDILGAIARYDTIIIHRHINPDPDALGAQGGLAEAIRAGYPKKRVYTVGSDTGNLNWLLEEQEIPDETYTGALVIVVDTADTPRISDDRFDQGAFLVKIDHHPNLEPFGDLVWVDPDASSCSELIYDLMQLSHGALPLTPAVARFLYAGLVGDTGRFMFSNTSPHTLEVAAKLIATGIDFAALNNRMNQITFAQAKLQSYVFEHLTISPNGAATVIIPLATVADLGLTADQVHAAVNTPARLGEVRAWAIFVEQPDGAPYRVNLRSKGPVINGLAQAHNGGGHELASGAKAQDQAEIAVITAELDALVAAATA